MQEIGQVQVMCHGGYCNHNPAFW